jgi:hypothetical protein
MRIAIRRWCFAKDRAQWGCGAKVNVPKNGYNHEEDRREMVCSRCLIHKKTDWMFNMVLNFSFTQPDLD